MKSLSVKKGDRVKVIAGADKGTVGEILAVFPKDQKVTVEGVNIKKRHRREQQTPSGRRIEGGIISVEAPIHVSNVQPVVDVDGVKDVPTRVGYERKDVTKLRADGSEYDAQRSVRVARKTGKELW